ncbi:MAG: hypothetical protein LQ352_005761 [Teloschistes flavicans]|nr:MAG: hypothetical protein LQ352_005761 [Teloschistes flavicans]
MTTDLQTAASHAAGVPVVSIEHYLNNTPVSSEPVQLGAPRTSHNVPMLHQLCQKRGLVAEYEIDGGQAEGFCGSVTVGQEVISSERRSPNKKEAKEALAELAVPVVKDMVAVGREKKAAGGEQERNWIGTLLGRSILNGFFSSSSSVGYLGLSRRLTALAHPSRIPQRPRPNPHLPGTHLHRIRPRPPLRLHLHPPSHRPHRRPDPIPGILRLPNHPLHHQKSRPQQRRQGSCPPPHLHRWPQRRRQR